MMLALPPRWERTVITQRDAIAQLLRDSPSLRREAAAIIAAELPIARRLALLSLAEHGETLGLHGDVAVQRRRGARELAPHWARNC
jgi:Domain of unknown function DUF29